MASGIHAGVLATKAMTQTLPLIGLACILFGGCEPFPGTTNSTGTSGGGTSDAGSVKRQPINAEKICTRLVDECGQSGPKSDCESELLAVLVTAACETALEAASCADLASSSSATTESCFPPCSGTLSSCNGDGTITVCTAAGTTNVLDCEESCRANGNLAFAGTCGTSYDGQVVDSPQCFCK
jgi:hypothetical protein